MATAEAPKTGRRVLGPRPSTADAGRYSKRSPNGQPNTERARRSQPSGGFWADSPGSADAAAVDPRTGRSLDSQRRAATALARRVEPSNIDIIAKHKPTRSLRDQVLTNHKIRPDDDMLKEGEM